MSTRIFTTVIALQGTFAQKALHDWQTTSTVESPAIQPLTTPPAVVPVVEHDWQKATFAGQAEIAAAKSMYNPNLNRTDIIALPPGQYHISSADVGGKTFGKYLFFEKKMTQFWDKFGKVVEWGGYAVIPLLFLAAYFSVYAFPTLYAASNFVGYASLAIGAVYIPIGLMILSDRIVLSKYGVQPWIVSYESVTVEGAFVLQWSLSIQTEEKAQLLHAKLVNNYDHGAGTKKSDVPFQMVAEPMLNPTTEVSVNEHLVYLKLVQNDGSGGQYLHVKGDRHIETSPLLKTPFRVTPTRWNFHFDFSE